MKKVQVKNATLKIPSGHLGHIGKYVPGVITSDKLPIQVRIQDPITQDEFDCKLISVLPFKDVIPEILCFHSEGLHPSACEQDVLARSNAKSVNQLAYYLYERNEDQH